MVFLFVYFLVNLLVCFESWWQHVGPALHYAASFIVVHELSVMRDLSRCDCLG